MWSSAGLGWGGWLELGQGEEQQPVVGTTALQLYSSPVPVCWSRDPAPPHSAAPRRYTRRPLRRCGSLSHGVVLSGDIAIPADTVRVYLPAPPHKPRVDITRNIKFIRM